METATPCNDRFAVPLADGCQVEAVWYPSGTLCLSTQVGCPLACPFCASGRHGWLRNLSRDEFDLQLEMCRVHGHQPLRLTLSGVGEPLANFAVVAGFISQLAAAGLPVSLTTTACRLDLLPEALQLPHNGLMLSLHAGRAATHRRLVPRGPDWDGLWQTLAGSWPGLSRRARRRVGINVLLLAGINDTDAELQGLLAQLTPFPELTVHLLQLNPVPGAPFRSAGEERLLAWHRVLQAAGVNVRCANRWRRQADGGCGTLLARRGQPGNAVLP